jgi:hypothetical protein
MQALFYNLGFRQWAPNAGPEHLPRALRAAEILVRVGEGGAASRTKY